jgi:hypothetical protein
MAAVLCSGIGGLCEGCGKLICLPFRACNCLCQETCKGCANLCTTLSGCCSSPFFPYFAITFLLNTPGIIYAIVAVVNTVVTCDDENQGQQQEDIVDNGAANSLLRWLIVNAVITVCHMVAAAYIVTQIRTPHNVSTTTASSPATPSTTTTSTTIPATTGTEIPKNDDNVESGASPPPSQPTPTSTTPITRPRLTGMDQVYNILKIPSRDVQGTPDSCDRVKFVLCFDPVVALYLIAFVFWIVWLAFGMGRAWSYDFDNNGEDDPCHKADLERYTNLTVMCGFLYVFLVGIAFSISLCCLIR